MDYTKFEYRWHFLGIDSVLDLPSVAKLPELLHQNPQVTVSEKLIGYTICMSSRGYVASKSKIIAYKDNLSEKTYKTQPLKSLRPIFKKLAIIAKELQTILQYTSESWTVPAFKWSIWAGPGHSIVVPNPGHKSPDFEWC